VKSAIILTPNAELASASAAPQATGALAAEPGAPARPSAAALAARMPPGAMLVQDGAASASGVTVFEINHSVTPAPAGAMPTPTLSLADLEPQARRALLTSDSSVPVGAASRGLLQQDATTSACCKVPKSALSCEHCSAVEGGFSWRAAAVPRGSRALRCRSALSPIPPLPPSLPCEHPQGRASGQT
jgi:hypothetical protein